MYQRIEITGERKGRIVAAHCRMNGIDPALVESADVFIDETSTLNVTVHARAKGYVDAVQIECRVDGR